MSYAAAENQTRHNEGVEVERQGGLLEIFKQVLPIGNDSRFSAMGTSGTTPTRTGNTEAHQ